MPISIEMCLFVFLVYVSKKGGDFFYQKNANKNWNSAVIGPFKKCVTFSSSSVRQIGAMKLSCVRFFSKYILVVFTLKPVKKRICYKLFE